MPSDNNFKTHCTMRILNQLLCFMALFLSVTCTATDHPDNSLYDFFQQHDSVMLLIDPDTGTIEDANPAAEAFYGYNRETLLTLSIHSLNTLTPAQVAEEMQVATAQGRNYFVFRHVLADGAVRTVEVRSHPYRFDGKLRLLSVINDITPGRHADQALWHYQDHLEEIVDLQVQALQQEKANRQRLLFVAVLLQMLAIVVLIILSISLFRTQKERTNLLHQQEKTNRELRRLNEIMAHHFQEPARRLVSFAQRLYKKGLVEADQDVRVSVDFIHQQALRLSYLVRDIQRYLALDQADAASQHLHLSEVIAQQMREPELSERLKHVSVELNLAEDSLYFPKGYLQQILRILFDNSLNYACADSPLRIEVKSLKQPGHTLIQFIDNGCGVEPEYREQLFEMFSRIVNEADKASSTGTGMGLAVLRKMVEKKGGWVNVHDGMGTGLMIEFAIEDPTP